VPSWFFDARRAFTGGGGKCSHNLVKRALASVEEKDIGGVAPFSWHAAGGENGKNEIIKTVLPNELMHTLAERTIGGEKKIRRGGN